MNFIQKGKRQLIIFSVVLLVLALGFFAGGIALIVSGAMDVAAADSAFKIVLKIVFGIVFILIGVVGVILGIIMIWTGCNIKAKYGNIAELNSLNGTINMKKCPKCGAAIAENDDFCGICGNHLEIFVKCPNCQKETDANKKHCTHCGNKLN